MMELHATGWNAWGQLCFDLPGKDKSLDEPDDIRTFTCVLRDETIENVQPYLSYTKVDTKSGVRTAGLEPANRKELPTSNGQLPRSFAEASNGVVVALDPEGIIQYPDMRSFCLEDGRHVWFSKPKGVVQVVAYSTGFAALTASGQVWTWGDERYDACLGREVSEESPADDPGLVTALVDLPTGSISKIVACGYTLGALTSGQDLYCWGGHPGTKPVLEGLTGEPSPVIVEDQDIVDVAMGESHIIVLTAERAVLCVGNNKSGQLGLGSDVESVDSWTSTHLNIGKGQEAVSIAAGPKNSFVIVRNRD